MPHLPAGNFLQPGELDAWDIVQGFGLAITAIWRDWIEVVVLDWTWFVARIQIRLGHYYIPLEVSMIPYKIIKIKNPLPKVLVDIPPTPKKIPVRFFKNVHPLTWKTNFVYSSKYDIGIHEEA
jgi:hypothetical protein